MIRLDQVSKTFPGTTMPAVDRVSLEVAEGEICVLLGPSGCGKTTTMKMVNRLIQPSAGDIFIDGRNTSDYDVTQLRRSIGYVIQQIGPRPRQNLRQEAKAAGLL